MKKNEKEFESMKDLVEKMGTNLVPIKQGSTYEVVVVSKTRNRIVVNVSDFTLGIIPEKEFSSEVYDLKPGDKILAYLLDMENDEGFAVLSLRRADRERIWQTLKTKLESGESFKVKVQEANKGGLIVLYGSIEGFIPISQLSQKYSIPRNDPSQMYGSLKKMVDKILEVKVINMDQANNKLIFSEKEANQFNQKEKIKDMFKVGEKVKGTITAVVPFGLFVEFGGSEGLVHISEISWDRITDINKLFKVGDEVETEIIDLENGKISLSIKRLMSDPWLKAVEKYKPNDIIEGTVSRITPFGAFVELDQKVTGLMHISELAKSTNDKKANKMEDVLEIGNKYSFKILNIENSAHRISLSLHEEKKPAKKTTKK